MEGVGVSYEAIVIDWARESEGFARSGTHGPVRGEKRGRSSQCCWL